jgi:hypothetical protein
MNELSGSKVPPESSSEKAGSNEKLKVVVGTGG